MDRSAEHQPCSARCRRTDPGMADGSNAVSVSMTKQFTRQFRSRASPGEPVCSIGHRSRPSLSAEFWGWPSTSGRTHRSEQVRMKGWVKVRRFRIVTLQTLGHRAHGSRPPTNDISRGVDDNSIADRRASGSLSAPPGGMSPSSPPQDGKAALDDLDDLVANYDDPVGTARHRACHMDRSGKGAAPRGAPDTPSPTDPARRTRPEGNDLTPDGVVVLRDAGPGYPAGRMAARNAGTAGTWAIPGPVMSPTVNDRAPRSFAQERHLSPELDQ
jgi:hypothetical protein